MTYYTTHRLWHVLTSASLLMFGATAIWSQSLTWLGTLGGDESEAYSVSTNGIVVGRSRNADGYWRAFRWTPSEGMQDLGTLGGNESGAYGISGDGSVIVGEATLPDGHWRAFRWTQTSRGLINLGVLPGTFNSYAMGVSGDGSVIVGSSSRAFRWTSVGMQDLGTLGGDVSHAYSASGNGSVVVGGSWTAVNQYHAFRWDQASGMRDLGTLGGSGSGAYAVSADGSVIAGWAHSATDLARAVRWTVAGGIQDLGTPHGTSSVAYGVSQDGSVIVGYFGTPQENHAFRWTSNGIEDLNVVYADLLPNGSFLELARAISPDGRYIVGIGYNAAAGRTEGFLLDTVPEPMSSLVLLTGLTYLIRFRRGKGIRFGTACAVANRCERHHGRSQIHIIGG
ncbi:hypothetical protein HRbin15_00052 [bacterium HR15]|nr:hypothetical protein HRbin15_00052 [bacterium HR15]